MAFLFMASPAISEIDTFTVRDSRGPTVCPYEFPTLHLLWGSRSRMAVAIGERLTIRLHGHGADLATGISAANIGATIGSRGTTTRYPNAPIRFGSTVAKGYLDVVVRPTQANGLGNRTVTVQWITGTEQLRFRIVRNCDDLRNTAYRSLPQTGNAGRPVGTPPSGGVRQAVPNLLPALASPTVLARPLGTPIMTLRGRMFAVSDFFCAGLAPNQATAVNVPDLVWGVSGTNIEVANSRFDVQLLDEGSNRLLDTLTLPQGFPANTPLVQRSNYPGRPTSIRVILNPNFNLPTGRSTFPGCFTEPGSSQTLEPTTLLLRVDPTNLIQEGQGEADNELRF